jgi:predicted RNA binding protein YcfA (HicA-like mRNA interferase family)
LKPVTGKALARALERNGWSLARVRGSHHIYTRPGSIVRLSVPVHGNAALKAGLALHLLKQAGLTPEDV